MIPVDNGRLIAERIPEARLRILEESGHLYPTEEPEVDDAIEAFLTAKGEEVR
jgi:pimeloyl-ACP methyl ester carboxylesterase